MPFIAVLSLIVKKWKQCRCPSIGKVLYKLRVSLKILCSSTPQEFKGNKRNICNILNESQRNYAEHVGKKPISKSQILCDSIYITNYIVNGRYKGQISTHQALGFRVKVGVVTREQDQGFLWW